MFRELKLGVEPLEYEGGGGGGGGGGVWFAKLFTSLLAAKIIVLFLIHTQATNSHGTAHSVCWNP